VSGKVKIEFEFDPAQFLKHRGRRRRKEESSHSRILLIARQIARRFARRHPFRLCTSDDVVEGLLKYGYCPSALGHAAGLVFRTEDWADTRFRVKSRRATSRGRELKVWQLVETNGEGGESGENNPGPSFGVLLDDYLKLKSFPTKSGFNEWLSGNGKGTHQ